MASSPSNGGSWIQDSLQHSGLGKRHSKLGISPNYLLTGLDPLRAYAIKVITDGRSSTSNNIKVLLQKKLAFIYSQTWKLLPPESWW